MDKPLKDPEFHQRLCSLIGNEAPFSWAARVGLSKGAFSRIWHEGTVPGPDLLRRIQDKTGVSIDWLLSGCGPHLSDHHGELRVRDAGPALQLDTPIPLRRNDDSYAVIPLLPGHAAAGCGPSRSCEIMDNALAFRRDWLRIELHTDPDDLHLLYIEGDSMEPVLRTRDIVLVDRKQAGEVPRDGIYVVRVDSSLLVKRIQRLPGGLLHLSSENPAYQTFTVDPAGDPVDIDVIGRVVWVGRRV